MVVMKNNIQIQCMALVLIDLFVDEYTTLRCFLPFLYVVLFNLWLDIIFIYIFIS